MPAAAIAFLLGTLCLLLLPELPSLRSGASSLLLAAAVLALAARRTRPLGFAVLGFLHAMQAAAGVLDARMPRPLEGRLLDVEGVVIALPARDPHRTRFRLRVQSVASASGASVDWSAGATLRLSWYERRGSPVPVLAGGERVALRVKLKRPRGLANPAGFDYERWLFSESIAATGYVVRALAPATPGHGSALLTWRAELARRLREAGAQAPRAAMLAALTLGDRSGLDGHEWEMLRATGTAHLVAISGLHVGMLGVLAFVIARRGWVIWPALPRALPAQRAAALAALAVAAGYAALAGFTLPTQRALVMVAVVMLALLSRRNTTSTGALGLALLLVLALDPMAALVAGFWLSFVATAVLLYVAVGRRVGTGGRWARVLGLQFALAFGLAPVALGVFGYQPMVSPFANLLAIPWTAWLIVPMALLGALLAALGLEIAWLPLQVAGSAADLQFDALSFLQEISGDWRLWREPSLAAVLAAMVGVGLLLLPRGARFRWLGLLWLAPLVFGAPSERASGALHVAVLDVGQGLAVLVRTTNHTLLYDAGPSYATGFDSGSAVVLPYLRRLGVRRLDVLLLSHANADHTGGAGALLAALPVKRVLHNGAVPGARSSPCLRGDRWHWDGVSFEVLHPADPALPGSGQNNASCVLLVRAPGGNVLLPGDLEAAGEARLLASGDDLRVTLLVVGHHGSRTSSSAALVAATRPSLAVFSAGYRNRYGFPAAEVRARLHRAGATLLSTAADGALLVDLGADDVEPALRRVRERRGALWRER